MFPDSKYLRLCKNYIFPTLILNKARNLGNIGLDDFVSWLQTSKVSVPKQQRIIEYLQKHSKAFSGMFEIISGIQKVKNSNY